MDEKTQSNRKTPSTLAGDPGKQVPDIYVLDDSHHEEKLIKTKPRKVLDWMPEEIRILSSQENQAEAKIVVEAFYKTPYDSQYTKTAVAARINKAMHPITVAAQLESMLKALFSHNNTKIDIREKESEDKP